jgi:glycine/D-amino acid oxidase-like deaminating enzyme/nitrite reductase/ring-hydroxylating ferredoxin subunit
MAALRSSESLWLDTAPASDRPALDRDLSVDVCVIGGGIAGITTALLLKRQGATVAVLERDKVANAATGYTTAKCSALQETMYSQIRRLHGDEGAAAYADANIASLDWIEETIRAESIDCDFERRPAYTYALDESEVEKVEQEADAAEGAGLPVTRTQTTDLPFEVPAAVRLEYQAQFQPVRYTRALADLVEGAGSFVFEGTAVVNVDDEDPCQVHTEAGHTVTAQQVVVATNMPILDRGVYFARIEMTRSYLVAAEVERAVEGMYINAGSTTRSVRSYERDGKTWLLIGGEGHQTGTTDAQPERYEALDAFAKEHWGTQTAPYRWSTQDGMPTDHLPMIGTLTPRTSRLFVATGFQKWGMTNGTIAGLLLADLIAGRENRWADRFSPHRVRSVVAPQAVELNVKAGLHFFGDRIAPAQTSTASDIPVGEARVVRDGLGKTGVYRDEEGELHAVSLRCTHLGCLLRFNDAEVSWDCPCHGSRFDVDGRVLQGPAVNPLERRYPPEDG